MKCQDLSHSHGQKKDLKKESEFFIEKLREAGFRITEQRKALIKSILNFKSPFTAEEVHSKLKLKGIDLTTVYRSLSSFVDVDLLRTVDFADGTLRYEYAAHEDEHHHHVICKKCQKVEAVEVCDVQIQEELVEKLGYTNISHRLEFFGICKQCKK